MSFIDQSAIREARLFVVDALARHLPASSMSDKRSMMFRALDQLERAANDNVSSEEFSGALESCFEALISNDVSTLEALLIVEEITAFRSTESVQTVFINIVALLAFSLVCERSVNFGFTTQRDLSDFKERCFTSVIRILDSASSAIENLADGPTLIRTTRQAFSALMEELSSRLETLPNVITYGGAVERPSIDLAHFLYGQAERSDQLEQFNRALNPVFMPTSGESLSA